MSTSLEAPRMAVETEVVTKAARRRFTAAEKLRVLKEADRCTKPGEVSALLRREGLYSSHLSARRQARNFIAALDVARGAATTWNPDANSIVNALAVVGGTVYAGGVFTSIGGQPHSGIVAVSPDPTLSVAGDPRFTGALTVEPNPTTGGVQIEYAVNRAGRVRLELLDVSGRITATVADGIQTPGRHAAAWDGTGRRGPLSPGLYFVRLVTPDQVMVKKLSMVRDMERP